MPARIKTGPKVALIAVGLIGLWFGLKAASNHGLLPSNIQKALTPTKANLPDVKDAQIPNVAPIPYPTSTCAPVPQTLVRGEIWEWSAMDGMLLATGGNCTTQGSLMQKHGVNLALIRQDDTSKMAEDLIACAKEIHDGAPQCSNGANFVVIMGDGSSQFAAQVNPQLLKLGSDYGVKVIGAVGYSRGEDAFMAPQIVKDNPQNFKNAPMTTVDGQELQTKGILVAGVLRDGDWNIALKWAGDNNIPNNPDEKTFDPDAINWISSSDYIQAAKDYVAGKCEERKIVKAGHPTGTTGKFCVNAIVTWTPGDVIAATQRGGLVKVVSSKEYRSQMPSVILGSGHFFAQNRNEIQSLLQASFEGADQIKAFDGALHKAAEVAAKIYNDEGGVDEHNRPYTGGAYWYRFFKPVQVRDAQQQMVSLGGSAVNNLQDNQILFGMEPGSNDNFRSTFNVFRSIVLQQYPHLFDEKGPTPLPDVKTVEDKSYLAGVVLNLANGEDAGGEADVQDFSKVGSSNVVSHRSYSINFATGSAQPLPDGEATLAQLRDQLAITGLKIRVDGYTDNTGSAQVNTALSQARAQEVKTWLQSKARKNFPDNRFVGVEGHGSDNPVSDNNTSAGKAANRRVDVTLVD